LIEIYRIVTRKTLEAGGDGPRPEAGTKIVLNQPGGQGAGAAVSTGRAGLTCAAGHARHVLSCSWV